MFSIKQITIGTDPEFVMMDDNGYCINARDIPYIDRNTSFGHDGDIFEIRSDYGHNTIYVVDSIYKILQEAYRTIKGAREYKWLAGHYQGGEAIGGHIHIGTLPINLDQTEGSRVADSLVKYLGKGLIGGLSKTLDNTTQVTKRHAMGYGHIGDWREGASHEGDDVDPHRVEYRGTGSFLISPDVTFLNLVVAKTIAMHYFNNKVSLNSMYERTTSLATLKELLTLMKDPILSREDDMGLGREVLRQCIDGEMRVNWDEDFKKNWGIK